MVEASVGLGAVMLLLFLGVPVVFAMGLTGLVGFAYLVSWPAAVSMAVSTVYETGLNYTLSVLPLFLLMGDLIHRAGLSRDLYQGAYGLLGHRRGGLAMATIVACGGFSALSGSSLATAATMGKVAMPSMLERGYDKSYAAGAIAAGGTLGILIPPSVILIIYGMLTDQDIGAMFIAGVIPGLLGIALYALAAWLVALLKPGVAPKGEKLPILQRLKMAKGFAVVVGLFVMIIGGIYGGVFTPTEAAGIGAFVGLVAVLVRRRKESGRELLESLRVSARTTVMIFLVIMGAAIFTSFINMTGMPETLSRYLIESGFSVWGILLGIVLMYLILGAVLEGISMILLTVPVLYPVIAELAIPGISSPDMAIIWFGILVVVLAEIGLITPPVGMNLFVLRSVLPDVELKEIMKGVVPFVLADIVRVGLLLLVPVLAIGLL